MKEMKYLEEQLEILNNQEYSMRINQLEVLLMKNKIPKIKKK